jgi:hypothetical protein
MQSAAISDGSLLCGAWVFCYLGLCLHWRPKKFLISHSGKRLNFELAEHFRLPNPSFFQFFGKVLISSVERTDSLAGISFRC